MKLWKRVFCVLPLILLLIQFTFKTVPLSPCVVQDGNQIKIYWTNFIYEYNLDVIVNYTMLFCLVILVVVGFTEKEKKDVWHEKENQRVKVKSKVQAHRKILFLLSGLWLLWVLAWIMKVKGDHKRK